MLNMCKFISHLRDAPPMDKDLAQINKLFDYIYSAVTYGDIPFEKFSNDDFWDLISEEFYEYLEKMYDLQNIIRLMPRIQQDDIDYI